MARNTSSQPITTISSTQITEIPTQTGFNAGDPVYFQNGDYKGPSGLTAPSQVNFGIGQQPSLLSGGNGSFGFPFNSYTQLDGTNQNNCGASTTQNQDNLIAAFTSGTGTSGAFTVTVGSNTGIVVGQKVTGKGIGFGATVSIIAGTTITLSVANSSAVSGNLSFLTGNIVQVYKSRASTYPYFRIVNSNGTIVYGPTAISATNAVTDSRIGVVALTGGGFAVSYNSSAAYVNVSVYSNTGTLVTANFNDALPAGTQNPYCTLAMTPLANGGFVLVTGNTSSNLYFKIYTATAGATTAFTSVGTLASYTNSFNVASRSDSSFIVAYPTSGIFAYALYNSAGGSITSAGISPPNGGSAYASANDVCCLADGTTYVIAFNDLNVANTEYVPTLYLLPSGNTLGSAITPVAKANLYSSSQGSVSGSYGILRLVPQYTGGFCLIFAPSMSSLYYVFSNASATTFYPGGTTAGNTNPAPIPNSFIYDTSTSASRLSVLENNGNITLYCNSWYANASVLNMIGFNISETTYNITPSLTGTFASAPTVSSNTGSFAPSQSFPTGLKYYAANTESQTYTSPAASVTVGPSVLNSFDVDSMHSCTLTNGNIVVAYRRNSTASTNSIFLSIFSSSGVLIQTLNPTLAYNTYGSIFYGIGGLRVCAMQNGKFALAYSTDQTTPSIISLVIFSSTYAITFNGAISGMVNQSNNNRSETGGFDICGLTGSDNIAMVYFGSSGQPYYAIISNTGTYLSGANIVGTTSWQIPSICANSYGGFAITAWYQGVNAQYLYNYAPSGSNTYAILNQGNFGGSTTAASTSATLKPFYSNGGALIAGCKSSVSSVYWQLNAFDTNGITSTPWYVYYAGATQPDGGVTTNLGCQALGASGYGSVVTAAVTGTSTPITLNITGYVPVAINAKASVFSTTVYTWPTTARTSVTIDISTTYGNLWITPAVGFGSFIIWRNSSGYVNYLVANTLGYSAPVGLIAGVSVSNYVPIYPTNTSTSGAVTNAVLAGIAATTASAGGSGQVIINGTAQLNSNYPASGTASFDHQGQGVDGVRGTVNGRLVNMQGNT